MEKTSLIRNDFMEGLRPEYCFPEKYVRNGEAFFKQYTYVSGISSMEIKPEGLKADGLRTCRFCKRQRPYVTFRKEAHVIPELLGRHNLISDFECDECNEFFGKCEDQLSKYLGFSRTMLSIKGKEKVPKFKSADKGMVIESSDDPVAGLSVSAERFDENNLSFSFDESKDLVTVTGKKQPYIPNMVYKSLLKMALSCLGEEDLEDYKEAFRYLRSPYPPIFAGGFTVANKYTMSYNFCYERPVALLFRKRDPNARLFSHMFMLFAMNQVYQFALPLNVLDMRLYGQKIDFPLAPPLFSNKYSFPIETIVHSVEDFSSTEQKRNEEDSFLFSYAFS